MVAYVIFKMSFYLEVICLRRAAVHLLIKVN